MTVATRTLDPSADIAIVIAVFNGATTLERCLDSISRQSLPVRQVIVMDGGSTDGTQDILARRRDVVTYWESARDKGIYDAWNKAVAHATATWVAFLGADDYLWNSGVIAKLEDTVSSVSEDVAFVYGKLFEIDVQGTVTEEHGVPWDVVARRFAYEMVLPHPGMLHRRERFFASGQFDSRYRIAGDYALLRQVLLESAPFFVNFPVAAAQEGGVSSHPNRRIESIKEVGLAIRACGDSPSWHWHWALLRNRLRWLIWRCCGNTTMEGVRTVYRALAGRQSRRAKS